MYRTRTDNVVFEKVNSWIGTPFGPDTFAVNLSFGYDQTGKWKAGFNYLLNLHGENGFGLFNKDVYTTTATYTGTDGEIWTYYPFTQYVIAEDSNSQEGMDAAVAKGRQKIMTGSIECKHQFSINGSYCFTPKMTLSAEFVYSLVLNAKHISGNLQQGIQTAVSFEYKFF